LKKAKGAYLWDQDDKKYVDYRLGFGPVVLGHAYEPVLEKIKEGLDIGNAFSMTHEFEISAAEKIKGINTKVGPINGFLKSLHNLPYQI